MYIRLRLLDSTDPNSSVQLKCKSVCQSIKDLKQCCLSVFGAPIDTRIRLFFNGKELDESYTLLDYEIRINDLIQVWLSKENSVQKETASIHSTDSGRESAESGEEECEVKEQTDLEEISQDAYYKIGDHVDALNSEYGAWFEGQITKIFQSKTSDIHRYDIKFWRSSLPDIQRVTLQEMRPPMNVKKRFIDLKINEKVLANCNLNNPSDLPGYWFDFLVTRIDSKRKLAIGTLSIGEIILKDHVIPKSSEFYEIRNNIPRAQRSAELNAIIHQGATTKRPTASECNICGDHPDVECFECACCKCGLKKNPEKQIVCDECNKFYHFWCHPSPIIELPEEDWYCYRCKNLDSSLIKAKEEEKFSRKRKRCTISSSRSLCSNDMPSWGRGISCVGRSRVCELVPKDHFGPIPNIPVGTWWRFRFQASEAGVHTPLVAGIHGKEKLGAFSIVFCCGYEEDVDLGDEIYYTGSGGRDSSEKKCRVGGKQVKDQEMKKCNKALAVSCYAKFSENGANAKSDWHRGKPVRVLRSGNARGCTKKSPYLPKIGVRYDGIYKVVRYWPEHNSDSGLLIWRYLLRRDDETPSPWSRQGKKRIKKLGLQLVLPPGYNDCMFKPLKSNKRKLCFSNETHSKRIKMEPYRLSESLLNLIADDKVNSSTWADILKFLPYGKEVFQNRVKEAFMCACCLGVVSEPIAMICGHCICEDCHVKLIESSLEVCPLCKENLWKKDFSLHKNVILKKILQSILSGHEKMWD
ncbi:E3 ubiquitin-protein ligase UHRF1-like [Brevipalpus obovatus]|uniref:E3 ubiquitin-protein ligase UHRF1-like n=1 Tax=Brevipalpus obovatus TaxID=246614 RepID=UPI003D9E9BB7